MHASLLEFDGRLTRPEDSARLACVLRPMKNRVPDCERTKRNLFQGERLGAIENTLSWRRHAMPRSRAAMGALYYTLHYADHGVHVRMPSADGA